MASMLQKDPAQSGNPNGGVENAQDLKTLLPEDMRSEKAFDNFKDVGSLGKSYLEMLKYQGQSVRIPGDDAKPEDVDKFYRRIGKPESADKYEITFPKDAPAKFTPDESKIKAFREVAHKLHLTNAQVKGLTEWEFQNGLSQFKQGEATLEQGMKSLTERYGDVAPNVVAKAQNLGPKIFSEKVMQLLEATGLANNADFIEDLAKASDKYFAEDQIVYGKSVMNAESAQEKIREIFANKEHPYFKGDKDAEREVERLHKIAYPDTL